MHYIKALFLILIASVHISCDIFDLSGLFFTTDVDSRMHYNLTLTENQAPIINDVQNYTFLIMADFHYKDNNPSYIKNAYSKIPDLSFIIVLGDITEAGLKTHYDSVKEDSVSVDIPVYHCIGNHDLYNGGYKYFKEYFGRTVYSFVIDKKLFLFMDTANSTLGIPQRQYITDLLNENYEEFMVFTHYSLIDKEIQSPTAMSNPEDTYFLFDVFEDSKVKFVFSGHLHTLLELNIRNTNYITIPASKDTYKKACLVRVTNAISNYEIVSLY